MKVGLVNTANGKRQEAGGLVKVGLVNTANGQEAGGLVKVGLVDNAELWYSCYCYRGSPTPERLHNFNVCVPEQGSLGTRLCMLHSDTAMCPVSSGTTRSSPMGPRQPLSVEEPSSNRCVCEPKNC